MAEITFMPGFQVNSNSSQRASASGLAWRLILRTTVLAIRVLPAYCQIFEHCQECIDQGDDGHGPKEPLMPGGRGVKQSAADCQEGECHDPVKLRLVVLLVHACFLSAIPNPRILRVRDPYDYQTLKVNLVSFPTPRHRYYMDPSLRFGISEKARCASGC